MAITYLNQSHRSLEQQGNEQNRDGRAIAVLSIKTGNPSGVSACAPCQPQTSRQLRHIRLPEGAGMGQPFAEKAIELKLFVRLVHARIRVPVAP